jgi:hypothetical protein
MLQIAKNVREAAKVNFALFVIVGLLGAGIWPVIYLAKRAKKINEALGVEIIPQWVVVAQIVLLCVTLVCRVFGESDDIIGLSVFTSLAMGIIYIVHAFKAKSILEHVVIDQWGIRGYKLNVVYAFFFTVFYVVYCLNDLETYVLRNGPAAQQPVAAHA